jgi:hypothetical protein
LIRPVGDGDLKIAYRLQAQDLSTGRFPASRPAANGHSVPNPVKFFSAYSPQTAYTFASRAGKNPGFTFSALTVLGLGIGANTTIFSVVNAVLLRPLPSPDSYSIVTVFHVPPAVAFPGVKSFAVSPANYLDWRKQNDLFESMSVFGGHNLRIGGGAEPRLLLATSSDSGLFDVLGVNRNSAASSPRTNASPAAMDVISNRLAREYSEDDKGWVPS